MHQIEPFYRWLKYYDSAVDPASPFNGKEYNYDLYSETIYGYYIDPAWDYMGSETLYIKLLYVNYELGYAIIEMIGEWNDALHNDIMHFKRNIIEALAFEGVNKYLLIGENVMNFHGSDDSYYEEWFEEVEEISANQSSGWISILGFQDHVLEEMKNFNIDSYFNYGGGLQINEWRTIHPLSLCKKIDEQIMKRLNA